MKEGLKPQKWSISDWSFALKDQLKRYVNSVHEEKICMATKVNLQENINAVWIKESTARQALKVHFEMHVALLSYNEYLATNWFVRHFENNCNKGISYERLTTFLPL